MNDSVTWGGRLSAAIVEQFGWVLLHSLWQFALVALIAEVARQAMRRRSAAARYAMLIVAMAAMIAMPVATWMCLPGKFSDPLPNQRVSALGPVTAPYAATSLEADAAQLASDPSLVRDPEFETPVPDVATASVTSERPPETRSHFSDNEPETLSWSERTAVVLRPWLAWIVVGWAFGVAACSLRPLLGWHTLRRLKRVGVSPVSDDVQGVMHYVAERLGVRRTVRVLKSTLAQVPVVVGYLRPVVLLPVSLATGLPTEQLAAILAHELAHVRRHDFLVNLLQTLVETFFFYHPAVWWLSRQVRIERENCCDDLVVTLLGKRVEYGRALLAIEELRGQSSLLALGATDGSLLSRVSRIVGSQADADAARWNDRWPVPFVGLACLGVAIVLSVSWNLAAKDDLVRQAQDSDDRAGSQDGLSLQVENRAAAPNVGSLDWPQFGRTSHRNNVAEGQRLPAVWSVEKNENIKWSAPLGNQTYSTPIVANGKVFIGTNNAHGYVKEHPAGEDLSCLLAFDEQTGKFLWQASNLKLPAGRAEDWPEIGICSSMYCEDSRVWYLTNRAEVVCLDAEGFRDNDENDGPVTNERLVGPHHADMIWRFDMIERLGMRPHQSAYCSVTCLGDRLFVVVNTGADQSMRKGANRAPPSFICLDKKSGGLLWTDNSASANVLDGHWSSPCAFEAGGQAQVVMEGGDGWVYSFDPIGDGHGHAKLLWKFDANPKESVYRLGGQGTRGFCVATPVFHDGWLYVGVGGNPEHGEGIGHLYCIDPTKRGDVSLELARDANDEPLAPRRLQAVDRTKGEKAIPNPNSAVVWHYSSIDRNGDGKIAFDETFHRTLGSPVIADGLLFIADYSGLLHCLDAQQSVNGQPVVYWTHDLLAAVWSTPLIADGKVFIADEDGEVAVFKLSAHETLLATIECGSPIYATPIVANGTLYVATKDRLIAVAEPTQRATSEPNNVREWQSPLEFRIAANVPEDGWEPVLPEDWEHRNYRDGRLPAGKDHAAGFAWYPLSQPWRSDAAFVVSRSTPETDEGNELLYLLSDQPEHGMLMDGSWSVLEAKVVRGKRNPAPGEERGYAINVRLDDAGQKRFAELVSSYRDMSLAVVMNGEIVGKLVLKEPSARLVFGGHFTKEWAEELVNQLNGLPPDPLATQFRFYANSVTLQEVLERILPEIAQRAGRKLSVDFDALKAAGAPLSKLVTIPVRDESLRQALERVLKESDVKLDYRLSDDGQELIVFVPPGETSVGPSAPPKGRAGQQPHVGRGSPDPALDPTAGLPKSDEETNPTNNATGDPRSNPAAAAGDPRLAQYVGLPPAPPKQQPAKSDQERMVGNWFIMNDDSLRKGEMWVIYEDRILMYAKHGGANAYLYLHRLDAGKDPKQIDITVTLVNGPPVGVIKGIYVLDGDELRLCLGALGKDRPAAFPQKPGPGEVLILRRPNPAAAAGDPRRAQDLASGQIEFEIIEGVTIANKKEEPPEPNVVREGPSPLEFRVAVNPADGDAGPRVPEDFLKRHYPDNTPQGRAAAKDRGFIWIPIAKPRDGGVRLPIEATRGELRVALLGDTTDTAFLLDGKGRVVQCRAVPDQNQPDSRWSIHVRLDEAAGAAFLRLTQSHLNQQLAMIVDGAIVAAPKIRSQIGTDVMITGDFSRDEADQLVAVILSESGEQPKPTGEGGKTEDKQEEPQQPNAGLELSGRLYVNAGLRTAEDETRFSQSVIAIDPNSGRWTRLRNVSESGFTVPLSHVRVSPDGRTMLYMQDKELWKCDAMTGERAERVLEQGSPAAWSPDGQTFMAVVEPNDRDGQFVENWVMSRDGQKQSVLALPKGDAVEDWSADGQWLVVRSRLDGKIYLVKPDGSGRRQLADSIEYALGHAGFSPDSRRVVYLSRQVLDDQSRFSLRTINVDGTGDREILGETKAGSEPDAALWTAPMAARWSPNGRHLAVVLFDHTRDGGILAINGNWRLAMIDADGGNLREFKLVGVLNTILPWDGPEWRPASDPMK